VSAFGSRVFYNDEQARRYGLENRAERCLECSVKQRCNFALDLAGNENLKAMYLDNEQYDAYFRDRCVFSDQIDIEDTMNVTVRYGSGAYLSYSLNAFSPYEGYKVAFNGTKGRLEHTCQETSYINSDGSVPGQLKPEGTSIKIFPHFKTPYAVEVRQGIGGHGGGDDLLIDDLFGQPQNDPLLRAASHIQGAYSILVGVAANESLKTGRSVAIDELVSGLTDPGYPPMPLEEPIPYVPDAVRSGV